MSLYVALYLLVSGFWLVLFSKLNLSFSRKILLKTFFIAMLMGPIAGIITFILEKSILEPTLAIREFYVFDFFLYFGLVGPIEESAKFLSVFMVIYRKSYIKNSSDGIIMSIAAALGFAAGENILYLLGYGFSNTVPRLILGNLGHCAFSVFWGYTLAVVLNEKVPLKILGGGLLLASILHGTYDYMLSFSLIGLIIACLFALFLFIFLFKFILIENSRNS